MTSEKNGFSSAAEFYYSKMLGKQYKLRLKLSLPSIATPLRNFNLIDAIKLWIGPIFFFIYIRK